MVLWLCPKLIDSMLMPLATYGFELRSVATVDAFRAIIWKKPDNVACT